MRVLMTTDTVGGVWTFTQELSSGLLHQSCAVCLVSLGATPTCQQHKWAVEMQQQCGDNFWFRSLDTPLEWMQKNDCSYMEAAPFLLHLATEFKADLIHSNQFCFGALPVLLPKVITAHSDVLSWSDCCQDARLDESAWLQQYRSMLRAGLKEANVVVAPTRWMLDALTRNVRVYGRQLVIPNGRNISVNFAEPRKLQAVTAGRLWDRAKNIRILADVDSPMPIIVAGQASMEDLPATSCNVRFVGALPQQALIALFQESAIYICTSRYEPFGLAPLEAALCGCAVLASDIPSLREVWEDGAIYFSNAAELSCTLDALQADATLLARTQARSLRQAGRYTLDAMASAYLSLFRSLLSPLELTRVA